MTSIEIFWEYLYIQIRRIYATIKMLCGIYISEGAFPWLLIAFLILMISFWLFFRKRYSIVFGVYSSVYFSFLFFITCYGRKQGYPMFYINPDKLFATYINLVATKGALPELLDLILNILLFIPAGLIFAQNNDLKKALLKIVCLTILIECFQLITGCGLFEFSDIIDNFIGGCLGLVIFKMSKKRRGEMAK